MEKRLIKLEGIYNFRDFGGLPTKDNNRIKYNFFFRSAKLNKATTEDIDFLLEKNINTIIDFRSYHEMINSSTPIIKDVNIYCLPALDETTDRLSPADLEAFLKQGSYDEYKDTMINMYKSLPFNNSSYRFLIDKVRVCEDNIILQHCTAGRDRTGVGSAILLLLLNVDRTTIENDYILSNHDFKDFFLPMLKGYQLDQNTIDLLFKILELKTDYINAALDEIILRYDSFENYFKVEFKLDNQDLLNIREFYTE